MKDFRENKLIKVTALVLVLIFGSQQVGWAQVVDLRDNAGFEDYALAIAAGYMSAQAINPSWKVAQIFAYTYLIPQVADELTKGINNPYIRAATSAFISGAAVGYLDTKHTMGELKAKAEEAIKNAEAWAQVAEATKETVFAPLTNIAASAAGAVKEAAEEAAKGLTKDALLKGALVEGVRDAATAAVGEYADKKGWGGAGYLAKVVVAQGIGGGMEAALGVKLGFEKGFGSWAKEASKYNFWKGLKRALKDKAFLRRLKVEAIRVLIEELGKAAGLNELLLTSVGAGLSRVLANRLTEKEEKAIRQKIQTQQEQVKVLEAEKNRVLDEQEKIRIERELKDLKYEISQSNSLLSEEKLFWQGVQLGLISAGMQYLSSRTKSPIHGAVFLAGSSAALQAALIREENLFKLQGMDEEYRERVSRERRGYWLFRDLIAQTVTQANANFYSFGRAGYREVGDGTFEFDWHSGNDAFFAARYTDYIKQVREKGLSVALAYQFSSTYFYQAVQNVYDITSGAINQRPYVNDLNQGLRLAISRRQLQDALSRLGDEQFKAAIAKISLQIQELEQRGIQDILAKKPNEQTDAEKRLVEEYNGARRTRGLLLVKERLESERNIFSWDYLASRELRQAERDWWRATGLHVLASLNAVLAGLVAMTLDPDEAAKEYARQIESLIKASAPYLSGEQEPELIKSLIEAQRALQRYLQLRRESRSTITTIIPTAIYGDMFNFGAFDPEKQGDSARGLQAFRGKYGRFVEIREEIPFAENIKYMDEQTGRLISYYLPSARAAVNEATIRSTEEAKRESIAQEIRASKPNLSEEEFERRVDEEINRRVKEQIEKETGAGARRRVAEYLSKTNLVGLAQFKRLSGQEFYMDRRQPKEQPIVEKPSAPVEALPSPKPSAPVVTPPSVVTPPPEIHPMPEQPTISWTWNQLLIDVSTGQTLGLSRTLRFTGPEGIVPTQLEKDIRGIWVDPDSGIKYGVFGEDTAVYFDKKQNCWRAVYDPEPAYDGIVDRSFGGSYRRYARAIIDNARRGGLSNPEVAIKFAQHNPWLIEEAMIKARVDENTAANLRQQLGIAHLPREEVKSLTEYGLDTNTWRVYRKVDKEWVYEHDATPGEIRQYQIYGDQYKAEGRVNIRTGESTIKYIPLSDSKRR